jgi:hypothetical protein
MAGYNIEDLHSYCHENALPYSTHLLERALQERHQGVMQLPQITAGEYRYIPGRFHDVQQKLQDAGLPIHLTPIEGDVFGRPFVILDDPTYEVRRAKLRKGERLPLELPKRTSTKLHSWQYILQKTIEDMTR